MHVCACKKTILKNKNTKIVNVFQLGINNTVSQTEVDLLLQVNWKTASLFIHKDKIQNANKKMIEMC